MASCNEKLLNVTLKRAKFSNASFKSLISNGLDLYSSYELLLIPHHFRNDCFGLQPWETCSSFIITRSPIFKLSLAPCHFALSCSSDRYSLSQRLQKESDKHCTSFQDLLYPYALMNTPSGTASSMEPDKTMLGVKAAVSFGDDGSSVIGRSFKIRSISVKASRDQIRRAKIL